MSHHSRFGTLVAPLDAGHSWKGWVPEYSDWVTSVAGVKNGILKPVYHVIELMKLGGCEITPALWSVRTGAKEAKNLIAVAEIPGKVNKLWEETVSWISDEAIVKIGSVPRTATYDSLFFASLDLVSPVCDMAEWWHARVTPLSSQAIAWIGRVNSIALLIGMIKGAADNISKIIASIDGIYRDDDPVKLQRHWTILTRSCIDLIKNISYIALAVIALVSAFVVTIAMASTYILLCSTSATVFTIVGEFAKRALPLPGDSKR